MSNLPGLVQGKISGQELAAHRSGQPLPVHLPTCEYVIEPPIEFQGEVYQYITLREPTCYENALSWQEHTKYQHPEAAEIHRIIFLIQAVSAAPLQLIRMFTTKQLLEASNVMVLGFTHPGEEAGNTQSE